MIVYHGTTRRVARRIARDGFQPKAPSRRVWFARNRFVAKRRSHHKASSIDRPVVLTCEIDVAQLDSYELAWMRCHKIGYIFQSYNILPVLTALENVSCRIDRG